MFGVNPKKKKKKQKKKTKKKKAKKNKKVMQAIVERPIAIISIIIILKVQYIGN
jgi:hypothetical protein